MADRIPDPDRGDDTAVRPDHDSPPGMPGWVRVFGIIVIVLILLVVIVTFVSGVEHGPGLHGPAGAAPGVEHDPAVHAPDTPGEVGASASGYTLSPIDAPETAAQAGTLSFSILGPDGEPVREFTETHERELHLIIVRTDTALYQHVHPTLDADGRWSIEWEWEAPGAYKLFADFLPTALGEALTLARTIEVAGDYAPQPLPGANRVSQVDDYTVTLSGDLVADESSRVTATIERDGQPVTNLQPYLGAYGHLVALRASDLAYLHVHPEGEPGDAATESGPEVAFHITAPSAGTYRLFFEFQVDGQVRTADFTVEGTESDGTGPGAPDAGHHGGH